MDGDGVNTRNLDGREWARSSGPGKIIGFASVLETATTWTPSSWRQLDPAQQPEWPDRASLDRAAHHVSTLPPLVIPTEVRSLISRLSDVAAGRAFLLQAGDCAESFAECSALPITGKLETIQQAAEVVSAAAGLPVVTMGRIAGQFAKPRSSPMEQFEGLKLPSFRGHMVNDHRPLAVARAADPERLIRAYYRSAATLNLLRALTLRGLGDERSLQQAEFWTSHEALILDYEEALTRWNSSSAGWFDCSAHFLWVGERTRDPAGAHVGFLAGIANPIGCKLGPGATPEQVVELCSILDPDHTPGRLVLIPRLGAGVIEDRLPPLLRAVRTEGYPAVWVSDPMHANTVLSASGRKTRRVDDITDELCGFFAACRAERVWPGGVHIELTGDDVTECLGGLEPDTITEDNIDRNYTTLCDPRLNAQQSLDLALRIAELLRDSVEFFRKGSGEIRGWPKRRRKSVERTSQGGMT